MIPTYAWALISVGAFLASLIVWVNAFLMCRRCRALNAETIRIQADVDATLATHLDVAARVEEWTV